MPPRYPFPWKIGFQLLRDAVLLRSRSALADSIACVGILDHQPRILNSINIPETGPCLLATNHYSRPGFHAWWIALGINAVIPVEVHWLMTAAWTFPESRLLQTFTPLTYWLFDRVARVYGFTTTAPMPPDPNQVEERARSVRKVLKFARESARPVIAIAPEGRDDPDGILGPPPAGMGRFIHQLAKHCQRIVPVGVYEDDRGLCICFGPAFELDPQPALSADLLDRRISGQVMRAIARQLPAGLRGEYEPLFSEDRFEATTTIVS